MWYMASEPGPSPTNEMQFTNGSNKGTNSVRELFCSCQWEVREMVNEWLASTKLHYCDVWVALSIQNVLFTF